MTTPIKTLRLPFSQGVLESQETSKVPVGFLTECINWVCEASGALRVRAKWFKGSTTSVPSTRRGMGIGMFTRFTTPRITQTSPTFQATLATGVTQTAVATWPVPTQYGSTLLCVITYGQISTATAPTITPASGWSTRATSTSTIVSPGATSAVLEYPNASSQQGDITPFDILQSTGSGAGYSYWLLELSGVATSPFDVSAESHTTGSATSTNLTATTSVTAQETELVIAVAGDTSYSSSVTLSTASSGWAEAIEATPLALGSSRYQEGALYTGSRSAIAAQSITVASTVAATAAVGSLIVLAYKGWYSAASPPTSVKSWLVAHDNTATYDIYQVDRDTLDSGATFSSIDSTVGTTTAGDPIAFTLGLGAAYYTTPTFTTLRKYDGGSASTVTNGPPGRCIAMHKERLWVGGTSQLPSRLFYSQIGSGDTWTGTGTGHFDVGRDDGEAIEDITPFLGGLVIGKSTSAEFLAGDNTDQFQLVPLNAGGAAPGRSVLATPYGCVLAGREQVWLYDGQTVIPIGRAIEQSYGVADGAFVSLSYQDGSIYIADGTACKVFVFDLNAGTWRIEQVGTDTNECPAVLYNYGDIQLFSPVSATVGSLLNYRNFPDPVRGKDFDSLSEVFSARTGDIAPAGARLPITPRQLYLQLRQRGGTAADPGLTVTPIFDGVDSTTPSELPAQTAGVTRQSVPGFAQTAATPTIGVEFSQTLASGEESCFDIEDAFLDFIPENARL